MRDPVPFLTALGQALATMTLYNEGHPARLRGVQAAFDELGQLLMDQGDLRFSFLTGDVVFGSRVLRELKDWEWASRLARIGVERLEFVVPVPFEEFREFVALVYETAKADSGEPLAPHFGATGVRYGRVALGGESLESLGRQVVTTTVSFSLQEEVEGLGWLHEQVERTGDVPMVETETIIRSLALTMHREGRVMLPLLELKEFDQYTTTHSSNVAVLSMGLAEYLGFAPRETRALGVAALLHDLGKVKVSPEVLRKPGKLTAEEYAEVARHTVEGAKLLLQRHRDLDLAAVVAYEHHRGFSGGGYPAVVFPRESHLASRMVQVCDVYDALQSVRPYRPPFPPDVALRIVEEEAGRSLDPDLVQAFGTMLRQAELRRVSVTAPAVEVAAAETMGT